MKVLYKGKYLAILPGDTPIDKRLLLGWRQKKNDPWIIAEDNIINRIVLGLPRVWQKDAASIDGLRTDGLEEFQIRDIKHISTLDHFLNANPMGLGKTVETVRFLQMRQAKNVLIVAPKIIREQWQAQLKRWGDFDSQIFEGNKKVTPGVWIVNYDKLRNEKVLMKFKEFQWDYLVLDEAHKIKSRRSQQSQAVKNIPAAHRIALTGTPILRYVDDLWSILNFLDPQYACYSYHTFVEYFCEQQETPWGPKITGLTKKPEKIALLNTLMESISIRNQSVSVARGKTYETVRLPMSKAQRELYRKERQLLLDELPKNCTIANGAVLTIRLMQTTSWPGLFIEGEPGPKFEWILEMCRNNPNEKIVVVTTFERTASALQKYLVEQGVYTRSITGKNTPEENGKSKEAFVKGRGRVLVGTIGAMGQGYDGLQEVSHTVVFIDRDWSPEICKQAEDRLHRMGQTKPVNVYYLECTGSFDQHVGRINLNKADDIREALRDEIHSSI